MNTTVESGRGHLDTFWSDATRIRGSVTVQVTRDAILFSIFSAGVCLLNQVLPMDLGIGVTPFEAAGAALGLLLVLRTNTGYERWWEGRKLWGGIVNQCRAWGLVCLAQGPRDPRWRDDVARWGIAFAHVCRHSLRGEREMPELVALIGMEESARLAQARHMPNAVLCRLSELLQEAYDDFACEPVRLLPAAQARASLCDYIGGCERIAKSPLPRVYSIQVRRIIVLFLVMLPFGMLPRLGWLTPVVTLLVAYPTLAIDQIGVELQNPFHPDHLGHLPLEDICATIEGDLRALLDHELGPPLPRDSASG